MRKFTQQDEWYGTTKQSYIFLRRHRRQVVKTSSCFSQMFEATAIITQEINLGALIFSLFNTLPKNILPSTDNAKLFKIIISPRAAFSYSMTNIEWAKWKLPAIKWEKVVFSFMSITRKKEVC